MKSILFSNFLSFTFSCFVGPFSVPESDPGCHVPFRYHSSLRLLLAVTVFQALLVFDGLASCEENWSNIECPLIEICLMFLL